MSGGDWTDPSWTADAPPAAPYYRPQNRRHLVKKRLLEIAAAAAAIWVVYAFVFSDYGLQNLLVLKGREAALKNEIALLRDDHATLLDEKGALKSDPRKLERVARESFKMGREGERLYVLVPVDSLGAPLDQNSLRTPSKLPLDAPEGAR
ncbi:MAG: FtsB family cell division protein [bacterium]